MPFNLITDRWLPVRRLSGERDLLRPADITADFDTDPVLNPILALDFPRPDWNAAVTEFLIGLLATVMAPKDAEAWHAIWSAPPTRDALHARLAPLAFAFNLDGDGSRCFQDRDPLIDCEPKRLSALLIEAPGEIADKKNTDLFVKRNLDVALCPAYAAAALVTMQTYAPSGGQGNRTSMRGGGPLTTLPLFQRTIEGQTVTTLWDLVWASVPDRRHVETPPTTPDDPNWARVFPWLAPTRTSEKNQPMLPDEHAHLLQQFFGMPRRIRLDIAPADGGACTLGGPAHDLLVRSFRQQNYGVKYEGWTHVLSPHRHDKKAGKLPLHPQPGDGTFRDWLTWVATPPDKTTQRAAILDDWEQRLKVITPAEDIASQAVDVWQATGVLAVGFDMDNMKARSWLEARVPFFHPPADCENPDQWTQDFMATVRQLIDGTDAAADALRRQVKIALYAKPDREGRYRLPENLPKDAYADLVERYWREMEAAFRAQTGVLRERPADDGPDKTIRTAFFRALRNHALDLFDELAGTDDLADQDAKRIVEARAGLQAAFGDTGQVRDAVGIMTQKAKNKRAERQAKRKDKKEPA